MKKTFGTIVREVSQIPVFVPDPDASNIERLPRETTPIRRKIQLVRERIYRMIIRKYGNPICIDHIPLAELGDLAGINNVQSDPLQEIQHSIVWDAFYLWNHLQKHPDASMPANLGELHELIVHDYERIQENERRTEKLDRLFDELLNHFTTSSR